jgi:hypothetical protein
MKWDHKLFTKWYISHIVSYSSRQTLMFAHIITFSNSYAPCILIQPYVAHNETHIFMFSIKVEENNLYAKN